MSQPDDFSLDDDLFRFDDEIDIQDNIPENKPNANNNTVMDSGKDFGDSSRKRS